MHKLFRHVLIAAVLMIGNESKGISADRDVKNGAIYITITN